jgi:hypothetical protein
MIETMPGLRRPIPPQPFPVLYTDHEDGHGAELYQAACSLGSGAGWADGATRRRWLIESKADMQEGSQASPDDGNALALTFAQEINLR